MSPRRASAHSRQSATNASRPRSWRDWPVLSFRSRSTTICVAMPAWSTPGTQRTARPCMRRQRQRTSSSVRPSAWPTCSRPVTFGGGITIVNGSAPPPAASDGDPGLLLRPVPAHLEGGRVEGLLELPHRLPRISERRISSNEEETRRSPLLLQSARSSSSRRSDETLGQLQGRRPRRCGARHAPRPVRAPGARCGRCPRPRAARRTIRPATPWVPSPG